MIILTNCLSDVVDEGCLKVANSLIRRIKEKGNAQVVTYGESPKREKLHFSVNKLMLNPKLLFFLGKRREPVLYIPAVAKAHTMAARIFIMSLFAPRGMRVLLVMQYQTGRIARLLLKLSGARFYTLSKASWEYYRALLGDRVEYLKTGVDTEKFQPVPQARKAELRQKYGFSQEEKLVLHIGHLRPGRNVAQLLALEPDLRGVLVASGYAARMQDQELKQRLQAKENVTLLDSYIPDIQEICQLADVYLFPVVAAHNCIDVPLSVLEAAACDIPVVATPYGELRELMGKEGFYQLESFQPEALNALLRQACGEGAHPRQHVLEYDWQRAVEKIMS